MTMTTFGHEERRIVECTFFVNERCDNAIRALLDSHDRAVEALAELVACKDLKDRIDSFEHTPECLKGAWEDCPQTKMEREYAQRKPLAWAAARAALSGDQAGEKT